MDHLFLDQDGVPTLVEVKRSTDSRIRREVVGQMMDYAANAVVHWPIETLRSKFESKCESESRDPDEEVNTFADGDDDDAVETFWSNVKTNLQAGRIRLVFVADIIPSELRRVIEFLNEQMDPAEVLAVEVKQFVGEGTKTLVPRVIGQTAASQQRKSVKSAARQWDEPQFFEAMKSEQGDEAVAIGRTLLDWSAPLVSRIYWGRGKIWGSFTPILDVRDSRSSEHHKLRFFTVSSDGTVAILFEYLKIRRPFDSEEKRLELLRRLNDIEGVDLPRDGIERRPSFPIKVLTKDEALSKFRQAVEWCIAEAKETWET